MTQNHTSPPSSPDESPIPLNITIPDFHTETSKNPKKRKISPTSSVIACTRCHEDKKKCIRDNSETSCRRCLSKGFSCIAREPQRRGRKKKRQKSIDDENEANDSSNSPLGSNSSSHSMGLRGHPGDGHHFPNNNASFPTNVRQTDNQGFSPSFSSLRGMPSILQRRIRTSGQDSRMPHTAQPNTPRDVSPTGSTPDSYMLLANAIPSQALSGVDSQRIPTAVLKQGQSNAHSQCSLQSTNSEAVSQHLPQQQHHSMTQTNPNHTSFGIPQNWLNYPQVTQLMNQTMIRNQNVLQSLMQQQNQQGILRGSPSAFSSSSATSPAASPLASVSGANNEDNIVHEYNLQQNSKQQGDTTNNTSGGGRNTPALTQPPNPLMDQLNEMTFQRILFLRNKIREVTEHISSQQQLVNSFIDELVLLLHFAASR
mmetsp:Transcript_7675/g.28772  ORF Transcript_7675/g.28772 Transcript_7675/m.28772 type:complete len:426 (+) Transcript_7675:111-1388(+)